MKRNLSNRSAFFIVRASAAFLLAVAGLALGFVAFGGLGGSSLQAQASPAEDADPDLPAFMAGKIDKGDYLERRAEHINKLRGLGRGRKVDPGARGRAIREMNQKSGVAQTSASTMSGSTSVGAFNLSLASISSSMWTPIGPSPLPNGQTFNTNNVPVSGRTVAIAIHPTNSNIAYVGAAQGGVYRTMDGGATWTPLFDNAQTLSIGAIAIAPSQPSTIYVGTGEGNFSADCFFGVGIYRIDNADTSSPTLTGPLNKNASNADVLSGWGIDKIIVHPTDPNTIFFGTTSGIGGVSGDAIGDTTATSTKPRALWRSTNAASANPVFQKLTAATDNGGNLSVTDVEFEPGNPNNLLVGIRGTSVAGSGGVYRSTNALAANPTFTRTLAVGSATVLTRTEIGIAKVGGQVTVFAATTDSSGTLKRSTDGGVTWSAALGGATGFCGGQCDYDMPVAVDPTNANVIYLGGPGDGSPAHIMIKSTNALAGTPTFTTVQTGLHADEHAIEIDPSNTSTVWTGNDGGLFKSTNGGTSWTSLNNSGYVATQFQSLALHPTDANFTIGGTQDNGTECQGPCGTFVGNVWNQADYGDGGFSAIDQSATNLTSVNMYHTYYNQTSTLIGYAFVTSPANAKFVSNPVSNSWSFSGTGGSVSCTSGGGYTCTEAVEFYMPMAMGPGTPNPLYTGTDRLHRAPTPGSSNATVSQVFVTGVPISAIGISRQNDSVRIVGLDNGKVFRTLTAQTSGWPDVTGTIPAGYVSRAVIDPNNQNTAYVTISDYFGNNTSHVYKTVNLNAATPTWTGVDGGQIPDVPVNAFAVDPANSSFLYAGTDIGVYRSTDGGSTWQPYSNGLPRVAVFDMAIQNPNRILRIATHGRGMWEIFIGATGTLTGTVTATGSNAPISGATVTGPGTATTDGNGVYQMSNVPVGTYNMTATADGYTSNTVGGVVVNDGQVTNQNFSLATAPLTGCLVDTTQADFQAGVSNNLDTITTPGDVKLSSTTGTVDQQQTTNLSTSGNAITTTTWEAQSFVPAISGKLTQVDADLFCSGCTGTTPAVTVELRTTSGGLPTGTVLATTTIPGFSSGAATFYSAAFSTPASVTAGTTYAYVLRMQTNPSAGTYAAIRTTNNQYANGAQIISTNSGSSWTGQNTDLGFRTYVSTGFASSGDLVSELNDSNPAPGGSQRWTTLSWTATTPANTTLKFQAAGSNNAAGPFTFVGPDGTAGTFFTTSGASLTQFNGNRYLKYKAYLSTTNLSVTPTLSDVTVCFNNTPKQNQTINFPAIADQTYGNPDIAPGATASSGLTVSVNAVGNCSMVGGNIHITGAGSCTVTATQSGDDFYFAAPSVQRSFNIAKRDATWTTNPNSKTYGNPDPNPVTTGSGSGFIAADNVSATYSRDPGETVAGGPYHITATLSPSGLATNYNITNNGADFTITKKNATWTTNNNSKTYGTSDPNPVTSGSGSGFVSSDNVTATYSRDPGETVAGSPYHITATLSPAAALDNYNVTNNGGSFSISRAHLTVTADNQSKTYDGSAFTVFTAVVSGFVNGDPATVVTGAPGFVGTATTAINAGSYTITPTVGTLTAANYDFTPFVDGTLTISKVHLTITANDKMRTYGTANPAFTATLSGFVNGETDAGLRSAGKLGGAPSFSGTGPSSTNTTTVGEYVITPAIGSLSATNYDFPAPNFVDGKLTITKAHLTVTANNQSKSYDGAVFSPFTAALSGFANGETDAGLRSSGALSGTAGFTGTATTGVNAGTYTITPTENTLSATNYDFTVFNNGSLTINKVHLTVTADNQSKPYDGAIFSPFTATITGFVNNETVDEVSGSPTFAGSAVGAVNAGTYTITPTLGTLGATNYDFPAINFVNGILTISKVHLTVTANDKSRPYGAANPTFTAALSGFVNSETDAGLRSTGKLTGSPSFSGTGPVSTPTTAVGSYVITPAIGSLSATNYDFPAGNFVDGSLSITKAHLTVTADDKSRSYGAANPGFTATLTGFANGETDAGLRGLGGLSGDADFSGTGPSSTATSDVGDYVITPSIGSLSATNYDFTPFIDGTLHITKTHLAVTSQNKSKDYDGSVYSPFTAVLSGFVNGETDSGLRASGGLSGAAGFSGSATTAVNAGTYTITPTQNTLSATNYDFTVFNNSTLTIYKVHLTVTANDKSKTYNGSAYSPFTATITGFVNNETVAVVAGSPGFTGTAVGAINAGSYIITPTQGGLSATNYDFAVFNSGTLVIYKVHLSVTADNKNKPYDGSPYSPFTATLSGFVNSETDAGLRATNALSGAAGYTGSAVGATDAGIYTITPTQNTLAATNYDFSVFNDGTLAIGQVTLTVKADNQSRQYSDLNPTLTYTVTGFVNGETSAVLSGAPSLNTVATTTSAVSSYTITITQGTLSATNYSFSFVNGTLTVTKETASLLYTGDSLVATKTAGGKATVNLAALVTEEADGNLGNTLGGNSIKFSVYKSNNTSMSTADYIVTGLIDGTTRVAMASLANLSADNYIVKLELIATNYSAELDNGVFTVVDPTAGAIGGGGWINDPEGGHGNFGFTSRFVKGGQPQGNNIYIQRKVMDLAAMGIVGAPSGARPYNVVFKSNAMSAMTTSATTTPKTGTFSGKTSIKAVDRVTGAIYNLSPTVNQNFQVDVTDNADPSSGTNPDTYALRVWTTTGNYKVVGTYTAGGANTAQVPLQGGNVQIR